MGQDKIFEKKLFFWSTIFIIAYKNFSIICRFGNDPNYFVKIIKSIILWLIISSNF